MRFYESMQYRQAVRDVITALASARYQAVNSGRAQDVSINPFTNTVTQNGESSALPDSVSLAVTSARELNRDRLAVIRFYPEGGSSGGDIDLQRTNGAGVRISIDWLVGRVSQVSYAVD
jgi:general secretion pathway protein H